jgi:AraC-like DNA-binding protein
MGLNKNVLSPYVRVAMNSVLKKGTVLSERIIYDYEMIFVRRGECRIRINGVDYVCENNNVILLRPGIPHSFYVEKCDFDQPHIHFDISYRSESDIIPISFKDVGDMNEKEKNFIHKNYFKKHQKTPFLYFKETDRFLEMFYAAIQARSSKDNLSAKGILITLISMVIKDNFPTTFEDVEDLLVEKQIKDYIDACQGFKMSLDDFAKQFSYSKFYLEKRFNESYGIGLVRYRNQKRLEYSLQLLKSLSVTKTAEELGYSSVFSFSRAFKKYFGEY